MGGLYIFTGTEEFSIKETADRSGYGDPLYFSSTFLKHYGSSPREYRKNKGPVSTGPRKE